MGRMSGAMAWVAIGAIVAVAGYGLRGIEQHVARAAGPAAARDVVPTMRITDIGTSDDPQEIHLDAAMARTALRQGAMLVQLPDGTHFPVRIERQQTHGGGHWSVIGRVSSPVGDQAMVLTFGGNAVMGLVPLPDGRAMQITTQADGRVTIAPAGGLRPGPIRYAMPGAPKNDYHVPPRGPSMDSQGTELDFAAQDTLRAPDPNDRTPVRIDVLALYSPELVALRGSRAAAEIEVAHMLAVADQALVDSGTRVRLHIVGFREVALPAALSNGETLEALTLGGFGTKIDFEALRDHTGADLVAFLRPVPDTNDGTCGASWLNGADLAGPDGLMAQHGYVVANVAPCGPYVLAHELGHTLGAAHDRAAQTDAEGRVHHGAFPFSFAHRTARFGTIMADPGQGAWIGRFSNPAQLACQGARCGISGRADNAGTIDLMAPEIARFREPAASKHGSAPVVAAEPLR